MLYRQNAAIGTDGNRVFGIIHCITTILASALLSINTRLKISMKDTYVSFWLDTLIILKCASHGLRKGSINKKKVDK